MPLFRAVDVVSCGGLDDTELAVDPRVDVLGVGVVICSLSTKTIFSILF